MRSSAPAAPCWKVPRAPSSAPGCVATSKRIACSGRAWACAWNPERTRDVVERLAAQPSAPCAPSDILAWGAGVQNFSERVGLPISRFEASLTSWSRRHAVTMTRSASPSSLTLVLAACGGGSDEPTVAGRRRCHRSRPPHPRPNRVVATFPASSPTAYRIVYAGGGGTAASVITNGIRRVTGIQALMSISHRLDPFDLASIPVDGSWTSTVGGRSHSRSPPLLRRLRHSSIPFTPTTGLRNRETGRRGPVAGLFGTRALHGGWAIPPLNLVARVPRCRLVTPSRPLGAIGPYTGIADGYWFDGKTRAASSAARRR